MNITFIGNCQTLALCFYFQKLLNTANYNICWVLYGDEFKQHIGKWSNKCRNKILNYEDGVQQIKNSDIVIYQNIKPEKSSFSNTKTLLEIKKDSCKLIQMPSIYLDYNDYENSIQKLIEREKRNNVDLTVSSIINKFKNKVLMLTLNHPKTFLFMEIVKILCKMMNIQFFTEIQYKRFLKLENYVGLP